MISQSDIDKLEALRTTVMSEAQQSGIIAISPARLQVLFADFFNVLLHDLDAVPTPTPTPTSPPSNV